MSDRTRKVCERVRKESEKDSETETKRERGDGERQRDREKQSDKRKGAWGIRGGIAKRHETVGRGDSLHP